MKHRRKKLASSRYVEITSGQTRLCTVSLRKSSSVFIVDLGNCRHKRLLVTLLSVLLIGVLLCPYLTSAGQPQVSCHYYVSVAKLGPICGLRTLASSPHRPGLLVPLASFLGIPYAAPPIGPLRFMPPGAFASSNIINNNTATSHRQYQLMPGGRVTTVQEFTEFGLQCVRLSNWLPAEVAKLPHDRESENCLKLNILVPIHESVERLNADLLSRQQNFNHENNSNSSQDNQANISIVNQGK